MSAEHGDSTEERPDILVKDVEESAGDDLLSVIDAAQGHEHDATEYKASFLERPKNYFVLSSSGKPIYSRFGTLDEITSYMGVIQAIISFYEASGDRLMSFATSNGSVRTVVMNEDPLYLVAISKLHESDAQLRAQLEAILHQILSAITYSQLKRLFSKRMNFDLRRFLGGTEVFLDSLADTMIQGNPSINLGAVKCLKLRSSVRESVSQIMIAKRPKDLLYGVLVGNGQMITVVRPKRHSLYPPDLNLLFSMIYNSSSFHQEEHWIPICLPKFNSKGFLYAYIIFLSPEIALLLITADRDAFFDNQSARKAITEELAHKGLLDSMQEAVRDSPFTTASIDAGAVQHFLYKSNHYLQYVMPVFEPPLDTETQQQILFRKYARLNARIHSKDNRVKLALVRDSEGLWFAWATSAFEFYCVADSSLSKHILIASINAILSWVRREENRLFITNGAVF